MDTVVIIIFCVLLLIAYLFDLTSSNTKVPSVILLLILGWLVRQSTIFFGIQLPDFSFILPMLGMVGLILIVLEGSFELEYNKSKIGLISKSFFGAIISVLITAFVFAFLFMYFGQFSLKDSLTNAIPFCIISSAIAIPSVRNLAPWNKEFIIYESSISDIFGVLFFTFISLNTVFNFNSFLYFGYEIVVMTIIAFIASIGLSFLLSKINHPIKFAPIIILIILIYSISEIYHLPALIFILIFGLFIGHIDTLKRFKWIEVFKPDLLIKEVRRLEELVIEAAFLVRALFFILFGYLIETSEILNVDTIYLAVLIVFVIISFRAIQLLISKLEITPLLFIAPRGLITILLFITISPESQIFLVNKSLIIQVIVISALVMMFGLMFSKKKEKIISPSPEK